MYTGIETLVLDDNSLADLYSGEYQNKDLYLNQYLIIKNLNDEIIDSGRWTGEKGFTKLKYKTISNILFGKFKPRNLEQTFLFDALQDQTLTGVLINGKMGTGKTIIALTYCLDQILSGKSKYDRVIYMRPPNTVQNTEELGFLPGTLREKSMPFALAMADIIGSVTELENLINQEKIVLENIGHVRGRSFKNSLVLISEGQNMTRETVALAVARISENSRLIIEGDFQQCDKKIFEKNSGMFHMINALKGDPEFSVVTLKKNERSRFSSLSDKILGIESD